MPRRSMLIIKEIFHLKNMINTSFVKWKNRYAMRDLVIQVLVGREITIEDLEKAIEQLLKDEKEDTENLEIKKE